MSSEETLWSAPQEFLPRIPRSRFCGRVTTPRASSCLSSRRCSPVTMAAALETSPPPSGLRGCGYLELLDLVRSLPRGSEVRNSACELLVGRYQTLVRSCVRRYRSSPESQEVLMQEGYDRLVYS